MISNVLGGCLRSRHPTAIEYPDQVQWGKNVGTQLGDGYHTNAHIHANFGELLEIPSWHNSVDECYGNLRKPLPLSSQVQFPVPLKSRFASFPANH